MTLLTRLPDEAEVGTDRVVLNARGKVLEILVGDTSEFMGATIQQPGQLATLAEINRIRHSSRPAFPRLSRRAGQRVEPPQNVPKDRRAAGAVCQHPESRE